MGALRWIGGVAALAGLLLTAGVAEPDERAAALAKREPAISFVSGRLSVDVTERPWSLLAGDLERATGISFHVLSSEDKAVTVDFRGLPLEPALSRLFGRDMNLVLIFEEAAPGTDALSSGPRAELPVEIWILGPGQRPPAIARRPLRLAAAPGQAPGRPPGSEPPDPRIRRIEALAEMDPEVAVPRLTAALADPDPRVRLAAVEALGDVALGDEPAALESLRRAATTDVDSDVRTTAVEALGWIGTAEALDPLRDAMRDREPTVRLTVVEAVLEIASAGEAVPRAQALLREAVSDPDADVREAAVEALRELREEASDEEQ